MRLGERSGSETLITEITQNVFRVIVYIPTLEDDHWLSIYLFNIDRQKRKIIVGI
ncbi:hypothetical protein MADA3029_1180020 [Vibrio nigripulchritudo MADA3029]|nr:hypothetical protein VNTUMSATTG_37450 [Vibrio nigripulchritudo]BDU33166.1 hypothetical protein TUMSATVNIG1_37750 [Vibrio nigripulchritudo]CCN49079.1 hypothetical protein VIBNIMADA3020_70020 [Vibrio nigripulchritudo MADA3020]CCN56233.1 hypothetical protein VIBNIMADA3021_910020 [Vibrio nigripulchritudo MADA3021]CCN57799.1 hypothetical protein MADA3029_1180020 [Vibrio nigripulchritudo MADA3029]